MEEVKKKSNGVDDSKEEYYRSLLQKVKRLARFDLIRKMDSYKQLSRFFLYRHHDWREDFNKFLNQGSNQVFCQAVKGYLNPAYKRVFKDFTETEFWWALLTDPQYKKNDRDVLLEDWYKWEIKNGTGYTSERAKEGLARLYSIYERKKQAETKETIERNVYLLNLFKDKEAIYDKFFERCREKQGVEIVNEIIAVVEVLYENRMNDVIKANKFTYTDIRTHLKNIGLNVREYTAFVYAFEYKSKRNATRREAQINTAKQEYLKLR